MSTKRYDIAEPKLPSDARLLYISSASFDGEWHSTPHSHQCTELFYVVGGAGGFQIENSIFPVKKHDLIVVNPHVQHTEISRNTTPLSYIVLGVEGLELSAPEPSEIPCWILNFEKLGDTVLTCMTLMLREVESKLPGADSVCQNLLQVLLVQLMRQTGISSGTALPSARHECATAKWYMDAHFKEKITLDLLAEMAGVNKYHLAHTFTGTYGISPIQYLTGKRITESKYLLTSTDLPLGGIVQMLGFSSPSYFARIFRRTEGMTPSEYRSRHRLK